MMNVRKRKMVLYFFLILIAAILFWFYILRQPSLEGNWEAHLQAQPAIKVENDTFYIDQIHDWFYGPDGPIRTETISAEFNFKKVKDVWFFVEPFEGNENIAHTMMVFRFTDNKMVGLTIEARKEVGEEYSALAGMARKFELLYIWANPSDMLTRRAVMLDHTLYAYPFDLEQQDQIVLLKSLIQRTNALLTKPRFYNTLRHNCTNEFAQAVNLPWSFAHVLTGKAPAYLAKKGYMDPQWATRKYDIAPQIRKIDAENFNIRFSQILDEIKASTKER